MTPLSLTPLLLSALALLAGYMLYIASRVARGETRAEAFLDAGQGLPGWAVMLLLPVLGVSAVGIERHLLLSARFGLQAVHVMVGLVVLAAAAMALWNRLWVATRVAGLSTPGEALGRYYDSIALRVVIIGLALLFALPVSADLLSSAARLLEDASAGAIPRAAGVWMFAVALAFPAIVGGWRGIVLGVALLSGLVALVLPGSAILALIAAPDPSFPAAPIAVGEGILWDRIPGVLRAVGGIGVALPQGGLFTTVAIASSVLSLVGIVLSPAVLYLGQTAQAGRGFGISAVWLTGGIAAGTMILALPVLAGLMGEGAVGLAAMLAAVEPLAGVLFLLMLLSGSIAAVAVFVVGGTLLVTRDLVLRYLLPGLSPRAQRLSARIALGFAFFFVAALGVFAPLLAAVLASLALPLSVQLLPAVLGLAFFRWISRDAILAGLTLGALIVVFTEPAGLILFDGLFVELPWGRWPLTIHSAAWGLAFNLLLVGLSAASTLRAPDRFERARLHDAVNASAPLRGAGRGLLWALALLWGFLAYGPGAILGNTFFSDPIFTALTADLGVPSLWVWQILFWLLGVVLLWWLAYRVGLGQTDAAAIRSIRFGDDAVRRTPDWLASALTRVVARPAGRSRRRA